MAYPTGELFVDLRAIADNWRIIQSKTSPTAECGAVVKANAYGLGVERIAPKLYQAGCRHFFVANLKEGMQLISLLGLDAKIYVLTGCIRGAEQAFIDRGLIPVIVSMEMLNRWADACRGQESCESVLKVNTGMGRLGVDLPELKDVCQKNAALLREAQVSMVMSHLACADDPGHELNDQQLHVFKDVVLQLKSELPNIKASLANSAGVFLGEGAHFDMVRPGIALYGGQVEGSEERMHPVVGLKLPIVQVRDLSPGQFVGYGATCKFDTPRKIAVVAGGYADGIFRSLSNCGQGWLRGKRVPIVGRISMDSTIFDITDVDGVETVEAGHSIELLGEHMLIDDLAATAGTIGYEVLTSFGARYQRCYVG